MVEIPIINRYQTEDSNVRFSAIIDPAKIDILDVGEMAIVTEYHNELKTHFEKHTRIKVGKSVYFTPLSIEEVMQIIVFNKFFKEYK